MQYENLIDVGALAREVESTLRDMGVDVKGISWFSSSASEYPKNQSMGKSPSQGVGLASKAKRT